MRGYIYVLTNAVNGKQYVGQTTWTVSEEWRSHRAKALAGNENCRMLYRAIRKYGADVFIVEEVAIILGAQLNLDLAERRWISDLCTRTHGYNIREGGSGGAHSVETRELMRRAALGKRHSQETRLKLSVARRRRVISEETKRKTSESLKRYVQSSEHRAKVQAAKVGHIVSAATRAKIGAANKLHAIARGWDVRP